ncbi:MAG TPA: galactose-1-phosphate uridylyltransferase [Clostridiales bacterium UBA8960]|nr:galactose-1-phosphate uridylyltransferase [Clostridiales bacterium UBA8960]
MDYFKAIEQLISYGLKHNLLFELDVEVVRNTLWKRLGLEGDLSPVNVAEEETRDIYELLDRMTGFAKSRGETLEYQYQVEMFHAEIMSILMPRNSEVNATFWSLHKTSPRHASDYFYALSNSSTYIRMDRVSKNISWKAATKYGELDITINLSKPEKDPKEIALQKHAKPSAYPKCLLCIENVGYSGNVNHPARHNHRVVEMVLNQEKWYLQYSPYVYYNEHAIVFCREHRNMKINRNTFIRLCDFVDFLPHYFIGSNADLHTVGGSILSHDHYQAGRYEMPMMRAKTHSIYSLKAYNDLVIEIIEWPLSVLKLVCASRESIIEVSSKLLDCWIDYSDEAVDLIANTDERHNTVTPILRKVNGVYEMYLALRNNRKSDLYPEGIFHPHREHHHIKKENIGLIEVMGLAVLPPRLVEEFDAVLKTVTVESETFEVDVDDLLSNELTAKHALWIKSLEAEFKQLEPSAYKERLEQKIGEKFCQVLQDSGIYKDNDVRIRSFLESCEEAFVK